MKTKNDPKTEHVVRKKIKIKAAPDQVWKALTDPEKTKKYFFGSKVISAWKKNSYISWVRKFLWRKMELKGKILDIKPGKFLKYKLRNASDKGKTWSHVTDTLTFSNGTTTLSVKDDVGKGEGAAKRFKRSNKAWDKVLKGLKKLVEKEAVLQLSK